MSHIVLVIPVFNEGAPIEAHLRAIVAAAAAIEPACTLRLLMVDDGSTDATAAVELGAHSGLPTQSHE